MKQLVVTAEATVTYTCTLSEEDSQKVRDYIGDTDLSFEDAVLELYFSGEINIYRDFIESDFSTEQIVQVEK
jgi:hypothetical protein